MKANQLYCIIEISTQYPQNSGKPQPPEGKPIGP